MATKDELSFDLQNPTVDQVLLDVMNAVGSQDWLDYKYPGYDDAADRWQYVEDHYRGDVLLDDRISTYLIQRMAAEHDTAFLERTAIAGYTPHLATVIDSLVGMLFAVESEAERVFQPEDSAEGLGDPEERGTPAWRLMTNTDGTGTNYAAHWQRFSTELVKFQELYLLAEGIRRDGSGSTVQESSLRTITPDMVRNKRADSSGRLVEVLVKHSADYRESIRDKPGLIDRYTLYELGGWTTWERHKAADGSTITTIHDEGSYAYWDGPERRYQILPIQRFRLPMSRHVAYLGARLSNRIFNTESERQIATRYGNISRFALVGNKEQFQKIVKTIQSGGNVIQHWPDQSVPHYYITPPTAPGELAGKQLEEYVQTFYTVMFSQFGDAAKERTATEIRHESRSGVEAFLTLASDTVDEAENMGLLLYAQTEFPDRPAAWGQAYVKRSKDFQPVDTEKAIERMKETYFPGKALPIGVSGRMEAVERIAEYDGLPFDEDEVEEEVAAQSSQEVIDEDARSAFGL